MEDNRFIKIEDLVCDKADVSYIRYHKMCDFQGAIIISFKNGDCETLKGSEDYMLSLFKVAEDKLIKTKP